MGNACLSVGYVQLLHIGNKVEVLFSHQKGAIAAETAILNMECNFGLKDVAARIELGQMFGSNFFPAVCGPPSALVNQELVAMVISPCCPLTD